ncbi:MAG: 23S rRNA (uracil(1939)-C(5))-methyltransferase RlmD [Eggerthellaceae bacterium]|nr:23S rRNA (uracil(1939)-C(5))-methyltransferase RlmD [Eggerthellaceae bacterium]MDR2716233.1 23S rRNA (uracil(1939)-C(5))-methyltransferase RlmD [Coriobacteriaceae bacterium]
MEEQVCIERLSYGSAGIGHTAEGKALFVADTVPGDVVAVSIDEDRGKYCRGRLVSLVEASPLRVAPGCPHHGSCGGCPWQQVAYAAQLEAKRDAVVSALVRVAHYGAKAAEGLVLPCKASKREAGYRNKLEFGGVWEEAGGFEMGFRQEGSAALSPVGACLVAHKPISESLKALRGALRYAQGGNDLGIYRVGIRASLRTRDLEVALWTRPGAFPRAHVARTLSSALRATSIVRVLAEPGATRKVKGVEALSGKGFWEEQLGGLAFATSAPSFFQVNTAQAEVLVDEVVAGLDLGGTPVVADLYAGGGTFSIPLAKHGCDVIAVEAASSSVRDLRRNAERNGAGIEIVGGDSARELAGLGALDALVVDPPRSGLAAEAVDGIAAARPQQVAYVSCDPATWARDVARFRERGYGLTRVQPVDMFPQTYHVECVSFFGKV